ncbi:MAG: putative urea ABC transporter substrate-binding protein [Caulobacterales bacterium]
MGNWLSNLRRAGAVLAMGLTLAACGKKEEAAAPPPAKTDFTIGWTIYAGWMPWPYAEKAGIVDKWEKKYGININVVQINDYVESLNQFTAGKLDGVTAASMDALTLPAASGHDSTVVIVGDYSNGNDGVVLKNGKSLADIKGRNVNLVEFSVSHYLLARALESAKLAPTDIKTVNTSDADIVASFGAPETKALVTWNPQLSEVKAMKGATEVFDSSKIPGEILDLMVVGTDSLKSNPNLGKALAGIWYETMAIMSAQTPEGAEARKVMGELSGTDLAGYESQLKTTFMYYKAADAVAFTQSADIVAGMDKVRQFSFANGLFGEGATSVDALGISFPGGKTLGSADNIKLRFDDTYMAEAASGALDK